MRTPAIVLVLLTSAGYLASPIQAQSQTPARIVSPNGTEMSTYYIVLLRRGPKWTSAVTPETSAVSTRTSRRGRRRFVTPA